MKFYLIIAVTVIGLSSCLKESIPDAMLGAKNPSGRARITATLSYAVNGHPVNLSVDDAGNQSPDSYKLGCTKMTTFYSLSALTSTGEFTFAFYTDSLTIGNYEFNRSWGEMYFLNYNGENEYVYGGYDNMNFNVTSYTDGHISGNFTGRLTPLVTASTINNIYGDPGSILITNGSFKDVPVFY